MTQRHDQLSSTAVSNTHTASLIQKTETHFPSAFDQTEIQNTGIIVPPPAERMPAAA